MRKIPAIHLAVAILAPLFLQASLSAHPQHDDGVPIPFSDWTLSGGQTLSAYLLKADADRVWLVDGADQTRIVPISELDSAGQSAARRAADRTRRINVIRSARQADAARPASEESPHFELVLAPPESATNAKSPEAAKVFAAFKRVKTRFDEQYLYVESDGLPDHPMMKGITAWQQQVPLPQPYTGENAWRVPLKPVVAKTPAMIKGRFLRGAIALAANGIPIFNPQNNRGEISQEIGELDEWGGHCGRADDYHYHATPMHLQATVGKGQPVAYALDGYPIYGLTEPDGSPMGALDECHGHTTPLGYHYHGATKYPYVMAGFHGEVIEKEGQVDPQPRARGVRPALPPLRGARIVDFKTTDKGQSELVYEVGGKKNYVRYIANGPTGFTFTFEDPQGQKTEQNYQARAGGGGGGGPGGGDRPPRNDNRPPRDDNRPPRDENRLPRENGNAPRAQAEPARPLAAAPVSPKKDGFVISSSVVADGGALPREFTGDGDSISPPVEWHGAPAGTKSFALIMHHIPGPGDVKWYWVLYNLPADVTSLPKAVKDVGTLGTNSVNGRAMYAPPHSKGPGAKTYFLTVYALSSPPPITVPAGRVDRETLLTAMKDKILASSEMKIIYDRTDLVKGAADGPEAGPGQRPAGGPAEGGRGNPGRGNGGRGDGAAGNRPPRNEGAGGPPGGGGDFHFIPRNAEERMNLTPEQQQKVAALEQETAEKLGKILNAEQMKILKDSRPPPPPDAPR